jgi:hypothetical protein
MHIFLDTNIFCGDPYWRNNYSKVPWRQLRDNKKLKFYIADIVLVKLKKNFELNSLSAINKVKETIKNFSESRGRIARPLFKNQKLQKTYTPATGKAALYT